MGRTTILRPLLLLGLLGLTACGWHLRGTLAMPEGLDTIYVNSEGDSDYLARSLRDLLEANEVRVQDSPAAAQLIINLLDYVEDRRVVAIGDNTLVTEYELIATADVSIEQTKGEIVLPETELTVIRSYQFDQDNVLAMAEEEALIQEEMRRELVQQIVRRLRFLNLQYETPTDEDPRAEGN